MEDVTLDDLQKLSLMDPMLRKKAVAGSTNNGAGKGEKNSKGEKKSQGEKKSKRSNMVDGKGDPNEMNDQDVTILPHSGK